MLLMESPYLCSPSFPCSSRTCHKSCSRLSRPCAVAQGVRPWVASWTWLGGGEASLVREGSARTIAKARLGGNERQDRRCGALEVGSDVHGRDMLYPGGCGEHARR